MSETVLQTDFCPECGGDRLREETCAGSHVVRERRIPVADDHHMACLDCGEWSYPGLMAGELQLGLARSERAMDGLCSLEDLRLARLRYGFTQGEMETLLGTGERTWVRWENGKVLPSKGVDAKIRRFLDEPGYVADLMTQTGVRNETATEVVASAIGRAKNRTVADVQSAHPEMSRTAIEMVIRGYDKHRRRSFRPSTAAMVDDDMIDAFRRHMNQVPVDLESLVIELGMQVYRDPNLGQNIAGKIVRDSMRGGRAGYAIYVNARNAPNRQRYTIAHEVAHYVLHRSSIGDGITEDAMHRGLPAPQEREAEAKAAEILMPEAAVRREFANSPEAAALAQLFKTSEEAMRIRLRELRLTA